MMRFYHLNLVFLGFCVCVLYLWAPFRAQKYVLREEASSESALPATDPPQDTLEVQRIRHQVDVLARTLYGEARGEGSEGMEAVGHVILNRLRHQKWGQSIVEIAQRNAQFSCWNHYDHNSRLIRRVDLSDPKFMEAFQIAQKVLMRDLGEDPTNGATHFHSIHVEPSWRSHMVKTAHIGDHVFYKDKNLVSAATLPGVGA